MFKSYIFCFVLFVNSICFAQSATYIPGTTDQINIGGSHDGNTIFVYGAINDFIIVHIKDYESGDSLFHEVFDVSGGGAELIINVSLDDDGASTLNYFEYVMTVGGQSTAPWLQPRFYVHGSMGMDTIKTGQRNDTVYGYGANDTIFTYGGVDTIVAGDGDDVVYSGTGRDVCNGGNVGFNDFADNFLDQGGVGHEDIYTKFKDVFNPTP